VEQRVVPQPCCTSNGHPTIPKCGRIEGFSGPCYERSVLNFRVSFPEHVGVNWVDLANRRKNKFTSSDVIEILLWQMGWYQLILTDRGYLCIALYRL